MGKLFPYPRQSHPLRVWKFREFVNDITTIQRRVDATPQQYSLATTTATSITYDETDNENNCHIDQLLLFIYTISLNSGVILSLTLLTLSVFEQHFSTLFPFLRVDYVWLCYRCQT